MSRWSSYYNKCGRCGNKFHASEGGCGCMDDLQCQCEQNQWDGEIHPTCNLCGTGSYVKGPTRATEHTARKVHNNRREGVQLIRPGDKYRRIVKFGHFPGGAFTLRIKKVRLVKGPNWDVAEMMES